MFRNTQVMRVIIVAFYGSSLAFASPVVTSGGLTEVKTHDHEKKEASPSKMEVNGSTPTGWVQIGTPRKWLYVILDTGSDKLVAKTWDTVKAELADVDQGIDGQVTPAATLYDSSQSETYFRRYVKNKKTSQFEPEKQEITYGSGSAIIDVGADTLQVGNRQLENFTLMEITKDSLQMLHTSKGIAGILGLQHMMNHSLGHSFFSRMRDEGKMTAFGYCRGTGNNGTFIWGDDSTEGHKVDVIGQMHWAVHLGDIKVEGVKSEKAEDDAPAGPDDTDDAPAGPDDTTDSGSLLEKRRTLKSDKATSKRSPFDEDGSGAKTVKVEISVPYEGAKLDGGALDAALKHVLGGDDVSAVDAALEHVLGGPGHAQELEEEEEDELKPEDLCPKHGCTGILDTGSNIIAGPTKAIKGITKLLDVKPDCSNLDQLPAISMNFGGQKVSVDPKGYVMKIPYPEGGAFGAASSGGDMGEAGLVQKRESKVKAEFGKRWKAAFERLDKEYGVDFKDMLDDILGKIQVSRQAPDEDSSESSSGSTDEPKFMCMPALVPIDQQTAFGPLWIVGTPLLQTYYARWSFAKNAKAPSIHLKALKDTDVCKGKAGVDSDAPAAPISSSTPDEGPHTHHYRHHHASLMRSEKTSGGNTWSPTVAVGQDNMQDGIIVRRLEDIKYPHWAKSLVHL